MAQTHPTIIRKQAPSAPAAAPAIDQNLRPQTQVSPLGVHDGAHNGSELQGTRIVPPLGLHAGIPHEIYNSWDALRSTIATAMHQSPYHGLCAATEGLAETESMITGRAVHTAALEPTLFADRFALRPRGKNGTAEKLSTTAGMSFKEECKQLGIEILTDTQWRHCEGMTKGIRRQDWYSALVDSSGFFELSSVWERDGVRCMTRIDRLTFAYHHREWAEPCQTIVELKTTSDSSPWGFERSVRKYGYAIQAAMQLEGLAQYDSTPTKFLWLVVDKTSPYSARIWEPSPEMLERGRERFHQAVQMWRQCRETDLWPEYDQTQSLLELAPWNRSDVEEVDQP